MPTRAPVSDLSSYDAFQSPAMTAISATQASEDLDSAIQALPQELQDAILAFSFEVPATVVISEKYRPPIALQLNRKLRGKFVVQYYGHAVFERTLHSILRSSEDREVTIGICRWLSTLTDEHRRMMRAVCVRLWPGVPTIGGSNNDAAFLFWGMLWFHRYDHCFDQLILTVKVMSDAGEEQWSHTVDSNEARQFHERTNWFLTRDWAPES